MNFLIRIQLVCFFITLATVSAFAQKANAAVKESKGEQSNESTKSKGLRKIAEGSSTRDLDVDVNIDQQALETNIELAIENAMRSVEVVLEQLQINIEPIEIDLSHLDIDIEPVVIDIPNIDIDIEPIEADLHDMDMDIDVDHDDFYLEEDDNEDTEEFRKGDSDSLDDRDKNKDKVKDKSSKVKEDKDNQKEKAKGLKKLN
jgi:hypothetical protein